MYCLPDSKNGDVNNVPVLLGMDHLSGKDAPESALTIDSSTGFAVQSMNPQPVIHQLQSNKKGHNVRDIVEYLTMGFSNHEGSPTIHRSNQPSCKHLTMTCQCMRRSWQGHVRIF